MNQAILVDSHCHLDLLEKDGFNIDDVITQCDQLNVKILQTICTRLVDLEKLISYTKKYPSVYASVGVHPCNVSKAPMIGSDEIEEICKKEQKIIGIGETGLDYYHDISTKNAQIESFLQHILASQNTGLPLIIHSRNADIDMMNILEAEQKKSAFPALLHCFSSSEELAKKALDLGIYISISGIITFKNATILQDIVKKVPIEFLLIETDSPYLAPIPHRGKANHPQFVHHVAKYIAQLKSISFDEVAKNTTNNFLKLFSKIGDGI